MNILYVLNSGQPGGMEYHVLDLVKGFVGTQNNVYVWCPKGQIADLYAASGATVVDRKITYEIDPGYILGLSTFIKKNKINLIHAHELKAVVNALIAGKLNNIPVITHTHTPISTWKVSRFKKYVDIFVYDFFVNKYSSAEIALTASRKSIKIGEGIKSKKLFVIPNAIDTSKFDVTADQRTLYREEILSRFDIPKDAVVIGDVSRLTSEKGHEVLVNAFKIFLESITEPEKYFMLLAGGGQLQESIQHRINELGLSNKIKISGVFIPDDQKKLYSAFDYFVFPSLSEGFGYVLIEAMYFGLPVLCSDLEVLQEVGGVTVKYFHTADSNDLALKIQELVRVPYDSKMLLEAKSRVLEMYTQKAFVNAYKNLYERFMV